MASDDTPKLPPFVKSNGLFLEAYLHAALASSLPLLAEEAAGHRAIAQARTAANTTLDEVLKLWNEQKNLLPSSEANVEYFVRNVCEKLGMLVSSQGSVPQEGATTQRVDLTLFADSSTLNMFAERIANNQRAVERYADALALVEVKQVDKNFNPKGAKGHDHPVRQIIDYLTFTGVPWGILTDGHRWRVYRRFDPPRFDLFLEMNLANILAMSDQTAQQEAFWWFYACFSRKPSTATNSKLA
jgi:hypothetical protein